MRAHRGASRRGAVRCGAVRCGAVRFGLVQCAVCPPTPHAQREAEGSEPNQKPPDSTSADLRTMLQLGAHVCVDVNV